jgi:hypothetical protein
LVNFGGAALRLRQSRPWIVGLEFILRKMRGRMVNARFIFSRNVALIAGLVKPPPEDGGLFRAAQDFPCRTDVRQGA